MFERVLESDPLTGVTELFQCDEYGKCKIISSYDSEPLLEDSKARYNNFDQRARWVRPQNHVAQIPPILYAEWCQTGMAWDQRAVARWLDDPDNRYFRTRPGRLSR